MGLARAVAEQNAAQSTETPDANNQPSATPNAWAMAMSSVAAVAADPAADDDDVWYLWPECAPIWRAWMGVQTQWRSDMAGNQGLDYAGVRADLRAGLGLAGKRLAEVWSCIKACEIATLEVWAEQRKRQQKRQGAG